ncbi:MAG: energy-coupling factor transporter ATPase [Pelolinea sp.]|nr:energy-coupling factor transporter ATPase [Pelolinea sp.]
MRSFIHLNNISFSYQERENPNPKVLVNLSLSIKEGEFVALIGQNGSGKSTLGKLLNALIIPDAGDVFIEGMNTHESANYPIIRSRVGMVFQRPQDQIVATTVAEDVAFGPGNLGLPPSEIRQQVDEVLALTGLASYRERPSYLLSAGETQRVALAGVLAMRPKCIIFDETTAMLDPSGREMVMRQAKALNKEGITIIFITHLMEEAVQADRVLILHHGQLVMDAPPAEVFSSSSKIRSYGLDLPPAALAADSLRKYFLSLPEGILFEGELLNVLPEYSGKGKLAEPENHEKIEQDLIIKVEDLSHVYLRGTPLAHQALEKCNLKVTSGSAHGLIGSTGSGKSTLLQHLNGLILPQSGRVNVLRYSLNDPELDVKALRRSVGLAFQQPEDQIFEQYVGDEIAFAARNFAITGKIADIVRSAMQAVGLDFESFKDRVTSTLSGGEQRKVALASVLAGQPQVLLLDEPLAGLDPLSRNEITDHLAELKKKGITLVISTHQFEGAVELMDKISVLANGRDFAHGTPGKIFSSENILDESGIKAPLVARIVGRLRNLGWPISAEIVTLKDLETSISSTNTGVEG